MKRAGWLDVGEVGGAIALQALVVVCTLFGRAAARAVLRLVALYYLLFNSRARLASRGWLERVSSGEPVSMRMIYKHLLQFSQVSLDRLFMVRRQGWRFEFRYHGEEHFRALRSATRGAIFLGAHLGSFEAMHTRAAEHDVAVNVLGYFRNAQMINACLRRFDQRAQARLIEIEPGKIDFIFALQDCIERGEHIAILGDRVGLDGDAVEVEFMGAQALLPTGAYRLAAVLHCPIYLFFGLYSEPNRYDIYCEPFAQQVVLPRHARSEAAREYAQQYADRLAHYCRVAPYNWFNFFDFWAPKE